MILALRPGPVVKAVDIYVVAAGEQMSQTLRRLYLMSAAQMNPSLLQRLSGRDGDFVKNMERFQELITQFQAGNGEAALTAYRQLPQSMREEKSSMLIAAQAAALVDDNEYVSMLEEFRRVHSNDPCSDIISIDYYFMRKEFDPALECINRLDTAVGGDPYLNIHRAQIMVERGELDEARKLCETAIETSPDEVDLHWVVVTVTLHQKKFADTVTWLNRLESEFNLEMSNLQNVPEYSEFVQSPEYSAWMEERNRTADQ
jgi:predicted Zn-dependent protease